MALILDKTYTGITSMTEITDLTSGTTGITYSVGDTFTGSSIVTGFGTGTIQALNAISGLQRGAAGTGTRDLIPVYQKVYSALSQDRLSDIYYNQTWNSYVYNPTLGDPLTVSNTYAANFLNADYA